MKNKIIVFAVNHSVSIIMLVLAVILIGSICLFNLKIDFLPTLQERNLLVSTEYAGISAQEMQKLITIPIEDSFISLKGLKNINSVTRDGLSLINIELHWGVDIDLILVEARELIDSCFETLPSGCSKPVVKIFNSAQADTMLITIIPKDNDLKYCRYIVDNEIKQRIHRIKGVGNVSVSGGEQEEIQVLLNQKELDSKGLSLEDVSNVLAASNFEYPAGTLKEGNKEFLLKTSGLYSSLKQISETPLAYNEGGVLKISDIGTVIKTSKEKKSFFIYNGKEAVSLSIKKSSSASPLELSKKIRNEINSLTNLYGKDYEFNILNDASEQIKISIIQLILSGVIGIIITFVILLYFFRTYSTSLLVSTVIPLSMIASVIFLFIFKKTINLLSLSGITVGIGMVIDNSIVVVENIHRWIFEQKRTEFVANIVGAVEEVLLSTLGSSLTTIVVFIPFFFLNGLLGELFSDMAISIIASIFFSCILSLTYIPALIFLVYNNQVFRLQRIRSFPFLEKNYSTSLIYFFAHKYMSFVILGLSILLGVVLSISLKKELMPVTSSSIINVEIFFPSGTSISKLYNSSIQLSDELNKKTYIEYVYIIGGIDESAKDILSDPSKQKERFFLTIYTHKRKEAEQQIDRILSGTDLKYSIQGKIDILSELLAIKKDSYIVTAENEEDVLKKTKELTSYDYQIVPYDYVSQQIFVPDREMCSRFNVTTMYAAQVVRNSLEGVESCYYYEEGRRIPIVVKLSKNQITNIKSLENTNIMLQESFVPVHILGSFHEEKTEKILYRSNRKAAKIISGKIKKIDDIPSLTDI
jgi:multidrug efflux pump subunit AcrB